MKGILKISFLLVTLVFLGTNTVSAQKFGHLNATALLASMPETQKAEQDLIAYKTQLEKDLESKLTAFQGKINTLRQKMQSLTPNQARAEQEQLAKEEQELYALRVKGEEDVMKKRAELFTPITDKADKAMRAVAAENGYTFIFDSSVFNVLLFAEDSADILPLVKSKLGL